MAGVSIIVIFGDNGIIKIAEDAAEKTKKAEQETLEGLEELSKQLTEKFPNGGYGSQGEVKGSLINQYLTPVNAVDIELFGREVNYSVPNEELAKKLGSENKWLLLYRGNSFSKKGEIESYLIMKNGVYQPWSPAAVDIDGNKTSYVPESINGGTNWTNVLKPYSNIPLEGNERFTPTNKRLCEFCKRTFWLIPSKY